MSEHWGQLDDEPTPNLPAVLLARQKCGVKKTAKKKVSIHTTVAAWLPMKTPAAPSALPVVTEPREEVTPFIPTNNVNMLDLALWTRIEMRPDFCRASPER
ncbi:hypothetical protein ACLOJK_008124 [Asimina triloba]